jgi:hypothetical protein
MIVSSSTHQPTRCTHSNQYDCKEDEGQGNDEKSHRVDGLLLAIAIVRLGLCEALAGGLEASPHDVVGDRHARIVK